MKRVGMEGHTTRNGVDEHALRKIEKVVKRDAKKNMGVDRKQVLLGVVQHNHWCG